VCVFWGGERQEGGGPPPPPPPPRQTPSHTTKLEHHVRANLDATSARVLMVLRPLQVSDGRKTLEQCLQDYLVPLLGMLWLFWRP
jgi:hypothetical protein